jgi:hypothetical protein
MEGYGPSYIGQGDERRYREGSVIFDVRESGPSGAHALQCRFAHSSVLSLEAFARGDTGVLSVIGPRVTTRIWLDGAETEHVDPAVEARHDRDDVDGIHVVAQKQCRGELHHTALAAS